MHEINMKQMISDHNGSNCSHYSNCDLLEGPLALLSPAQPEAEGSLGHDFQSCFPAWQSASSLYQDSNMYIISNIYSRNI